MELPRRPVSDVYVPAGGYKRLVEDLSLSTVASHWSPVIVYAFDNRTRLMPFRWLDKRVVPCGVRSIAASLLECGLHKTRVVLQQWTPNFRPSAAVRAGHPIDLLIVSSMALHSEEAYKQIRDAHTLGENRPLILVGGPKAIYEPEDYFAPVPDVLGAGPDVAVTGEEYVLLELLRLLADHSLPGEHPRRVFERVRNAGLLDFVPGLVYRAPDADPDKPYLINTGVQRLVQDLDELPMPLAGYTVLEPPHRRKTLSRQPLSALEARKRSFLSTLVVTHGCRFNCEFCPIPAYQQRTWRHKSPQRIADEMKQLAETLGFRYFFGTDDNFFNSRESVQAILTAMAKSTVHGKPFRDAVRFTTEATEFDVYKNRDLLPLARDAGLYSIYFGIEDLNAKFINKGQTVGKTEDLFREMRQHAIEPYAMMIHHDDQPFWSKNPEKLGVVNQAMELFRLGAVGYHTTYITPSPGARNVETMMSEGNVFESVGGQEIPEAFIDGNHVIASRHRHAWIRQLQLWGAYLAFYNPINAVRTLLADQRKIHNRRRFRWQMIGLSMIPASILKALPYTLSLAFRKIQRYDAIPPRPLPMVDASSGEMIRWGMDGAVPYDVQRAPRQLNPLAGSQDETQLLHILPAATSASAAEPSCSAGQNEGGSPKVWPLRRAG